MIWLIDWLSQEFPFTDIVWLKKEIFEKDRK